MNMKDMTVTALSELTASLSPAPGGGSISALAGAFAASLVCMVAKLTQNKKGYEEVSGQMEALDKQAEALRVELLDDIQKDSESFNAYMDALALPKESEEEKTARKLAMQEALKGACQVPLAVAGKCLGVMHLALTAVEKGNRNAASDGMVGVLMARAAVLGAVNNVLINLGSIKDEGFVSRMKAACEKMEVLANQKEQTAVSALHTR